MTEQEIALTWWDQHGLRHYDPQQNNREEIMKWAFLQGRESMAKEYKEAFDSQLDNKQ
jgi:hypothetical protein